MRFRIQKKQHLFKILLIFTFLINNLYSHIIDENYDKSFNIELTSSEHKYLEDKKVIRVMNLENFPPFNFYENNKAVGYTIDYINLMSKYLDIEFEFVSGLPWSEYLKMLQNGQLDLIPHIAITNERKKSIDFTDFKHIIYPIGLITSKDSKIKSITDLYGKTIAVAQKTFLHTHLKKNFPKINIITKKTSLEALETLYHGKADAAIGSLPSLNYYVQDKWMNSLKSVIIDDLGISNNVQLPMGVKKGNIELKSILEKVNSIIPPNEIQNLKSKWFSSKNIIDKNILTNEEYEYLDLKKEILMCIDPDWMPLEKNQNGIHIGMSADYMDILKRSIGIDIKMVPTESWSESIQYGKERRCDIFSMIMNTKDRQSFLDFTKPYLEMPLVLATNIEQFFVNDINSIIDKKIGIVKDYAFVEILKKKYPNIKLIEVKSVNDGLLKVKEKELFGFVGALSTVGYSIQRSYVSDLKIAGKFDEKWLLSVGIRNDEPHLKNIFNKAIDTLTPKNDQEILNKWVSVSYEKGTDYKTLYQASIIFLIVILVVLYKNRTVSIINKKLRVANEEIIAQQQMVDKYVLIISTDLKGVIIDVNSAFCKALGYKKEELIGKKHLILNHPDIKNSFFEELKMLLKQNKTWVGEIKNLTKNKEVCWLHSYIEPVFTNGKKIAYRSICENITNKKRIEELSITDKLTNLYNRLKLDEILVSQIEEYRRYGNEFSIIILDIDNFKEVNDTFGHDIGDYVLQTCSKIIKSNIRVCDIVGRWGGEEFLIVCKNTQAQNAKVLAEHLKEKFENYEFKYVGRKTISLGVTQFTKKDTVNSVFKRADEALYEAKNTGKNKAVLI